MAIRLAESMRLTQPKGVAGNGHIVNSSDCATGKPERSNGPMVRLLRSSGRKNGGRRHLRSLPAIPDIPLGGMCGTMGCLPRIRLGFTTSRKRKRGRESGDSRGGASPSGIDSCFIRATRRRPGWGTGLMPG